MKTPATDFPTLQAKAALHGFECTATLAGNIVMSCGAGAWIFDSLTAAAAWLSLSVGEVPA